VLVFFHMAAALSRQNIANDSSLSPFPMLTSLAVSREVRHFPSNTSSLRASVPP